MIQHVRKSRILPLVCGVIILVSTLALAQATAIETGKDKAQAAATLRIDPLLVAEAGEVWGVIASSQNPIWPGWDASGTPLLFYLTGEQDVLLNHPHPPDGFIPYEGPVRFPGGNVFVKSGPTLIDWDGQNTSKDVGGVRTLVVADTLSNLRAHVSNLLQGPGPTAEKIQSLHFQELATDPYSQLAMVAHEAFHVFQDKHAPDKRANEMLLLYYPVLSVQNNVEFAQEGSALAAALHARYDAEFRHAALRWLALRQDRRSALPQKAREYEDGVEFSEGLAKYIEYRLFQVLEGRQPGPAMSWAQGFDGYANLAPQREQLIERMVRNMYGEVSVNNDPYGTAPLRMRLYYSGMGIGVLLDRLSPEWKTRILAPDVSLTSLALEALTPSPAQLVEALKEARSGADYAALVEKKTKLAEDGKAHTDAMVTEIESGPGLGLIVDYSQLGSPKLGMAFTPFGITAVDENRTIFAQVPIKVSLAPAGEVAQTVPAPLLRDTGRKLFRFRLPSNATKAEIAKALGSAPADGSVVSQLTLDLPGATIKAAKAQVKWSGQDLVIVLLKGNAER